MDIPFNVFARLMPDASDETLAANPDNLLPREMGLDFKTKELRYRDDNGKLYTLDMTRLVEDLYYPRLLECIHTQAEIPVGTGLTPVVDNRAVMKPGLFPSLKVKLTTNTLAGSQYRMPCLVIKDSSSNIVDFVKLPVGMQTGETYDVVSGILYKADGVTVKSCAEPKFLSYNAGYTMQLVTAVNAKITTLSSTSPLASYVSNESNITVGKTSISNIMDSGETYRLTDFISLKKISDEKYDYVSATIGVDKRSITGLDNGSTYEYLIATDMPLTATITHVVIDTKYPFLQWMQNIINKVNSLSEQELFNDIYATPNTIVQRNSKGQSYIGDTVFFSNDNNYLISNTGGVFSAKQNPTAYADFNFRNVITNSGDLIVRNGDNGVVTTIQQSWKTGWLKGQVFKDDTDNTVIARYGMSGGDGTNQKTVTGFYITNNNNTDRKAMLFVDPVGNIYTQDKKVWTELNQGHGSTMDSDLLDHQEGREYARTLIEFSTLTNTNILAEFDIDTTATKQFVSHLRVIVSPYTAGKTTMIYDVIINADTSGISMKILDVLEHTAVPDTIDFYIKATDASNKAMFINVKASNVYCRVLDMSSYTNTANMADYYYKAILNKGAVAVPAGVTKVIPGKALSTFNMGEGSGINADLVRGWTLYDNLTQLGLSLTGQNTIVSIVGKMVDKSMAVLVTDNSQVAPLPNSTTSNNAGTLRITRYSAARVVVEYFDANSTESWYTTVNNGTLAGFEKSIDASDVDVNPTINKIIQRDTNGNAIIVDSLFFGSAKDDYIKFTNATNRFAFATNNGGGLTVLEAKGGFDTTKIALTSSGLAGNGTDNNTFNIGHTSNTDNFDIYGTRMNVVKSKITLGNDQEVSSRVTPAASFTTGTWYTIAKSVADGSGMKGSATFRLWSTNGYHQVTFTVSAAYSTDVLLNVINNITRNNTTLGDSKVFSDIRVLRNKDAAKQDLLRDLIIQVKTSSAIANTNALNNGLEALIFMNSGSNLWLDGSFEKTDVTNYDVLFTTPIGDGSTSITGDKSRFDGTVTFKKDIFAQTNIRVGTDDSGNGGATIKYDTTTSSLSVVNQAGALSDITAKSIKLNNVTRVDERGMMFDISSANTNDFSKGILFQDTNKSNILTGFMGIAGKGGIIRSFILGNGSNNGRGGTNNLFWVDDVGNIEVLAGKKVWTELNDGHGSTLDADTVDTFHATDLARIIAKASTTNSTSILNLKYALSDTTTSIIHHFRVLLNSTYTDTTNAGMYDVILNIYGTKSGATYTCKVMATHADNDPLTFYVYKDGTAGQIVFRIGLNQYSSVKVLDQSFASTVDFSTCFSSDIGSDSTGTPVAPIRYLTVASASIPASTLNGWKIYTEIADLGLSGTPTVINIIEKMQNKSLLYATTNSTNIEVLPNSTTYANSGLLEIVRLSDTRCEVRYYNHDTADCWTGIYRSNRTPKFSGFSKIINSNDTSENISNSSVPVRTSTGAIKANAVFFDNDGVASVSHVLQYNKTNATYSFYGNGTNPATLVANGGLNVNNKTYYQETGIATAGTGLTYSIGNSNRKDILKIYGDMSTTDRLIVPGQAMNESSYGEGVTFPAVPKGTTTKLVIATHDGNSGAYGDFMMTYSTSGMHGYIRFSAYSLYGQQNTITIHDMAMYSGQQPNYTTGAYTQAVISNIEIYQQTADSVYGKYAIVVTVNPQEADLPANAITINVNRTAGLRQTAPVLWQLCDTVTPPVDITQYTSKVSLAVERQYSILTTKGIKTYQVTTTNDIYAGGRVYCSELKFNNGYYITATSPNGIMEFKDSTNAVCNISSKVSYANEYMINASSQYGITIKISDSMKTAWRRGIFFKDNENDVLVGSITLNGGDGTDPNKITALAVTDSSTASPNPTDMLLYAGSDGNMYIKGKKVWNEYNDGDGSGLDADKIKGCHIFTSKQVASHNDIIQILITLPDMSILTMYATLPVGGVTTNTSMYGIPANGMLTVYKPAYNKAYLQFASDDGIFYTSSLQYSSGAPANSTLSAWVAGSGGGGTTSTQITSKASGAPSTLKSGDIWIATY